MPEAVIPHRRHDERGSARREILLGVDREARNIRERWRVLALGFAGSAAALFAAIPLSAVGALLLLAGTDLAVSKRLFDARPDCWPVIAVTAGATALLNPAVGLAAGWVVELGRSAFKRLRDASRDQRAL